MRQAADMLEHLAHDREASNQCRALASEIEAALREHSVVVNEKFGRIYSYEVDGYGNSYCVGDGAVPGLLSLPYISAVGVGDPVYLNTRKLLLSDGNPYYRKGQAGEGIGDPRPGQNRISPLAFVVQGLTTADDDEVRRCLASLQKTHAGTGFIHEWFDADDAKQFGAAPTAAINSIFGDLILKTYKERPYLLNV
jgi:meiotically up-regulated gene 157 (Mug157) protein